MLEDLVGLVTEHQPNALIIAGDIFDSPNPPAEAQRLFYQTLVRLHRACPSMTTVISAGNHDAANRLEAPRALLAAIGVQVIGNVRRQNGLTLSSGHLIPIHSPSGELLGHVLTVSYPTAACLPAVDGKRSLVAAVEELYRDLVSQTRAQWEGLPLVLTGHLHVAGSEISEDSERPILIGGENAIPANLFPTEAAYIALGHLHKPQRVGTEHIRYSGSLLPMSASEIDYKHGVALVEIAATKVTVKHLPLARPLAFHRVPRTGFASQAAVRGLLAELFATPGLVIDERPYVYLRLEREGLSPAFREELDREAEALGLRILEIRLRDLPEAATSLENAVNPGLAVEDLDPSHFFELAFQRTHGKAPGPQHAAAFQLAYEESQAV